ncbi:MAG: glycogen/starch/alpha-glucan phosphorylase, partial [Clostridia bacterium]
MELNKEKFKTDYKRKMISLYRESVENAGDSLKYMALGSLLMDYMASAWHDTEVKYETEKCKQVYYFSMEFLVGRLMDAALLNLGIKEAVQEGLLELGTELAKLEEIEPDAGLGNGGLGRLAACFLDSMASLGIAGTGIGIRYRYGLFEQQIRNGYQIESPDNWLKIKNVWETRRDDEACMVKFGGNVETNWGSDGRLYVHLKDYEPILAVPYD